MRNTKLFSDNFIITLYLFINCIYLYFDLNCADVFVNSVYN